jgi:hypothetical protein
MSTLTQTELGRLIVRAHYQAWRADAPPLDLSIDELAAILPNLIKSGSAGLVWPKVQPVRERYGALAFALEAAYNSIPEYNDRAQEAIAAVVGRLNDAGIESILVKGWSMSRLYPSPAIRPAGDIDLVVHKNEYAFARAIINDSTKPPFGIDVDLKHPGIWKECPGGDFWSRSRQVRVGSASVTVLCPEDTLRTQCFHYWKHRGMRLLWVCDVALGLELSDVHLEWDRILSGTRFDLDRIRSLLAAAQQILGVSADNWPPALAQMQPPAWLKPALLEQWANADGYANEALAALKANPAGVVRIFTDRASGPIQATVHLRAPFNHFPRFPIQLASYALKLAEYPIRELTRQFPRYTRFRPG